MHRKSRKLCGRIVLSLIYVSAFAVDEDTAEVENAASETTASDGAEYLVFDSGEDMVWLFWHF